MELFIFLIPYSGNEAKPALNCTTQHAMFQEFGGKMGNRSVYPPMHSVKLNKNKTIINSEPEPQILDYTTQQHKLFIAIASSHAFRVTGWWLWELYSGVMKEIAENNVERLGEVYQLIENASIINIFFLFSFNFL